MTDASISVPAATGPAASRRRWRQRLRAARLPLILATLLLAFAVLEPTMISAGNLRNMLIQASYLVIFACAQMLVIVVRGFDLSLGTAVSTISVASAMVMVHLAQSGTPADTAVALGIAAGIAIGALIGAANGVVVSYLRVNPFVATFGMLNICLGLSSSLSGGFQIFDLPAAFNETFYRSAPLGIHTPVIASVAVLIFCHVLLERTRFGRSLCILGSNARAAAVAGLDSRALLAGAYASCSVLVAVGALLLTARTGSGEPNLGGSLMLESIAAAVIGGISLRGGQASVVAPLMGALIITVLSAGMNLARFDGYLQQILLGLVIVATVFLDQGRRSVR